jgi:hypothetical protein
MNPMEQVYLTYGFFLLACMLIGGLLYFFTSKTPQLFGLVLLGCSTTVVVVLIIGMTIIEVVYLQ